MSKQLLKKYALIASGLLSTFCVPWILVQFGMAAETANICGIFVGSLILWLTISIDWPSVLCIGLLGMLPSIGFKKVFQLSFGDTTFAFLLFTFLCTYALSKTPFLKRIAISMMNSQMAKKGGWSFFFMFVASVYLIGLFVSPTVLFVVFLPIFEEICRVLHLEKGDRTAQFLIISMIFTIALATGATPISHVFSVMAIGAYQKATEMVISHTAYMSFAIPVTLLLLLVWFATAKWIYRPDLSMIRNIDLTHMKKDLNKMERREIVTVFVFLLVVFLWISPELLKGYFPETMTMLSTFGTAFPPIMGVIILAVIHIDGEPLIHFPEALAKGVHWPSLLMAAATLALGGAFTMEGIGVTGILGNYLSPIASSLAPMIMVLFFVAWASIQTNLSSNIVTVSVVTAIAIAVIQSVAGDSVNLAAVCCLIGFMASLAYATPPAMPYVAISIGSGWAQAGAVLRYGLWMMFWSVLFATFIGYPIAIMVM